jgi:predicted N-formylglutamate amidohydrolase
MGLLTKTDPPPFEVVRETGTSDLFLTADHAGQVIPAALGNLGLSEAELQRHIAWDIGIAATTRHLSELLDATAILQTYSRLVIDCNRDPSWPSAMPEISELTPVPGNLDLSPTDRAARTEAIFTPYHTRITQLLNARQKAGRRTILIAMHSFTPVFKNERRDMQVGVLYNKDPLYASALKALLEAEGDLIVGDNAPYAITDKSDYGIPVHGELRGLRHVEIEIRQDLLADASGQIGWAKRLARLLPNAAESL